MGSDIDGTPLEDPPSTIGDAVRRAAERFGPTEALVDDRHRLDFTELAANGDAAARAVLATGAQRGDPVAVWAPNVAEWVFAALGALTVGCPVVPLNTRFRPAEAADVIRRSRAGVAVCTEGFLGRSYATELVGLVGELPHLRHVVAVPLPDGATPAPPVPAGATGWDDFMAAGAPVSDADLDEARRAVTSEDLGDIIFTSGTTGHPKGVVTTHAQSLRAFADWSGVVGLTHGDRYLVVNPFFHTFGYKAGILACLLRGATIVCEPVFDAGRVLTRIGSERISMLPGPPTLYLTILEHPDRHDVDLSSLRLAGTGAAAVPVEMVRRMHTDLGFDTVITGYGLTEATGVVAMCRAGDDPETIATTSGRAIPDVEVRIVDEAGIEVARGDAGEIVCRGYNVMVGYLDDPAATAEAIDGVIELGQTTTDQSGSFIGQVVLPSDLPSGNYTLQFVGTTPQGEVRVINIGVVVDESETVVEPTIMLTGSRSGRIVRIEGFSTGINGQTVSPRFKLRGQVGYTAGSARRIVDDEGRFTWQRRAGKTLYVYFVADSIRSTVVRIPGR